jgi:hypothetical protein
MMTAERHGTGSWFDFTDFEGEATPLPAADPAAPDPGFPTGAMPVLSAPRRTQPLFRLGAEGEPCGAATPVHRAGAFEPSDSPLATTQMSQQEICASLIDAAAAAGAAARRAAGAAQAVAPPVDLRRAAEAQRAAERPSTVLVPPLPAPRTEPLWPYAMLLVAGFVSGLLVGLAV